MSKKNLLTRLVLCGLVVGGSCLYGMKAEAMEYTEQEHVWPKSSKKYWDDKCGYSQIFKNCMTEDSRGGGALCLIDPWIFRGRVWANVDSILANFENNTLVLSKTKLAKGGAISSSYGNIGPIVGDFENNRVKNTSGLPNAEAQGGAIFNGGSTAKIDVIHGNFTHNTAQTETGSAYGGAIANESGSIKGFKPRPSISSKYCQPKPASTTNYFSDNKAEGGWGAYGGAIANVEGTIGRDKEGVSVTAFENNSVTAAGEAAGGAIYNSLGNIGWMKDNVNSGAGDGTVPGFIKGNTATATGADGIAYGGAIYNDSNISSIAYNFSTNSAAGHIASGGAIYNGEKAGGIGSIGSIEGTFKGNTAGSSETMDADKAYGGAIYNTGSITNGISKTTFEANSVRSVSQAYGGAIYNGSYLPGVEDTSAIGPLTFLVSGSGEQGRHFGFVENFAEAGENGSAYGGAIYNAGIMAPIVDAEFIGNYAHAGEEAKGGAIYTAQDMTIRAKNADSIFRGNTVTTSTELNALGDAIYIEGARTLTLDAGKGRHITFEANQNIYGENAKVAVTGLGDVDINNAILAVKETAVASGSSLNFSAGSKLSGRLDNKGTVNGLEKSTFEDYAVEQSPYASGGAINNEGTINVGISETTFRGNKVTATNYASGGAIFNSGSLGPISTADPMSTIVGFIGNKATAKSADGTAGTAYGGAIYNEGTMGVIIDADFLDNSANGVTSAKGGAIYTTQDMTIRAQEHDVYFEGNTVTAADPADALGSAVYIDGAGQLTLETEKNKAIIFGWDQTVYGKDATVAVTGAGTVEVDEGAMFAVSRTTVSNGATLSVSDGSIDSDLENSGTVTVINTGSINGAVTNNNGAKLSTAADRMGKSMTNNGTLTLSGGTIGIPISAAAGNSGRLDINGDTTLGAAISNQNITIKGGTLTANSATDYLGTTDNLMLYGSLDMTSETPVYNTLTVGTLGSDKGLLSFEVAMGANEIQSDKIVAKSMAYGDIILDSVNITVDAVGEEYPHVLHLIESEDVSGLDISGTVTATSRGYRYEFKQDSVNKGDLTITRENVGKLSDIVQNKEDSGYKMGNVATYSMLDNIEVDDDLGSLTRVDAATPNTAGGDTARTFTVNGNGYTLASTSDTRGGISVVNNGDTLNLTDVTMDGFYIPVTVAQKDATANLDGVTFSNTIGTADVANDGTLNISGTANFDKGVSGTGSIVSNGDLNVASTASITNAVKFESGRLNNAGIVSGEITGEFRDNAVEEAANAKGGAIFNGGTLGTLVDTDFVDNSANGGAEAKGGAIYTTSAMTIRAQDSNIVFRGNTVKATAENGVAQGSAVYIDGAKELTLEVANGRSITFDGTSDGEHIEQTVYGPTATVSIKELADGNTGIVELKDGSRFDVNLTTVGKNAVLKISGSDPRGESIRVGSTINGEGTTEIDAKVTSGKPIATKVIINAGKSLETTTYNLTNQNDDLTNNGTLTLTGSMLQQNIVGSGTTVINGSISNGKNIGTAVTVNNGKSLYTMGTVSGALTNNGSVTNVGGTISGALTNNGTVTNTGTISGKVTNNSGAKLTSFASYLTNTNDLTNDGTLTLQGGTTKQNIVGNGMTVISGAVTNAKDIGTAVTINEGSSLATDAQSLTGSAAVANAGTLTLGDGILGRNITGAGTTVINGTVWSDMSIANAVTVNAGKNLVLGMEGSVSGNITNNGMLSAVADNIGRPVENNGVYNVDGGTIGKAITAAAPGGGTLKLTDYVTLGAAVSNQNIEVDEGGVLTANSTTEYLDATDNLKLDGILNMTSETPVYNTVTVGTLASTNGVVIFEAAIGADEVQSDKIVAATKAQGNLTVDSVNITMDDGGQAPGTTKVIHLVESPDVSGLTIDSTATATSGSYRYEFRQDSENKGDLIATKEYAGTLAEIIQNEEVFGYKQGRTGTYSMLDNIKVYDDLGSLTRVDAATPNTAGGNTARTFTVNGNGYTLASTSDTRGGISVVNSGDTLNLTDVTVDGFSTAVTNAAGATTNLSGVSFSNTLGAADVVNDGTLNINGATEFWTTFDKGINGTGSTNVNADTDMDTASITQGSVTVGEGGTLVVAADKLNVTNGVSNEKGMLNLTGGRLSSNITGAGTTVINGIVWSDLSIANAVTVNEERSLELGPRGSVSGNITNNGTLCAAAGNIGGTVENNGVYNVEGGTISKAITATVSGGGTLNITDNVTLGAAVTNQNIEVDEGEILTVNSVTDYLDATDNLKLDGILDMTSATPVYNTVTVGTLASTNGVLIFEAAIGADEVQSDKIVAATKAQGTLTVGSVNITMDDDGQASGTTKVINLVESPDVSGLTIDGTATATSGGFCYEFRQDSENKGNLIATKNYAGTLAEIIQNEEIYGYKQGNIGTYSMLKDVKVDDDLGSLTRVDAAEPGTAGGETVRTFTVNGNGHKLTSENKGGISVVNKGDSLNLTNVTVDGFSTAVTGAVGTTTNLSGVTFSNTLSAADVVNDGTLNLNGTTAFDKGINGTGSTNINADTDMGTASIIQDSVTVREGRTLTVDAGKLNATKGVTNEKGTLNLTGGRLSSNITGKGSTVIAGAVSNADKTIANTVTIEGTNSLTTEASLVKGGVTNRAGTLSLTGGTLGSSISGAGSSVINGTVIIGADKSVANKVTINEKNSLTADADSLTNKNDLTNNGTLNLTGGTTQQNIIGRGTTNIDGEVTNEKNISTAVQVGNGAKLSTTADGLGDSPNVTNSGELTISDGESLNVKEGHSFTNSEIGVFNGDLEVYYGGTVTNMGTMNGFIANSGTLNLKGGSVGSIDSTGTVNVYAPTKATGDMRIAGTLNFDLPKNAQSGDTMLDISGVLDMRGAEVDVDIKDTIHMKPGDSIDLAKAAGGIENLKRKVVSFDAGIVTLRSEVSAADGNTMKFNLWSAEQNEHTKAPTEAVAAAASLVNEAADFAAGSLSNNLNALGSSGMDIFGTVGGGSSRYETGSHVNSRSWNFAMGLGRKNVDKNKNATSYGVFFEYGKSNFDTYNDDFRGDGRSNYRGIGVLVNHERANGVHYEASARLGKVDADWNNAAVGGYDDKATYYGFHAGVGKKIAVGKRNTLDIYGKYFFNRTGSMKGNVVGYDYSFDEVKSNRLRIGARMEFNSHFAMRNAQLTPNPKAQAPIPYIGLAWEHEFSGDAGATINYGVGRIDAPSLRGNTGILELGLKWRTGKWDLNLGVEGYTGVRKGVSGGIKFNYNF